MSANMPSPEELFHEARGITPPAEREGFLRGACGADLALRSKVEALLRADDEAGAFLASGEHADAIQDASGNSLPREQIGAMIGRYKLLQEIGEGGFGVVYMAEQKLPMRRKVALKVIKLGMDTRQVIARFEAERQALAMMDHAHIAKVLDAGATDSGRPYFVMELVKGIAITDYCDQNNLTIEERLKLFTLVCSAVQHAHQKGIIHRDIKPSNVLVTLHDGVPVPKVIDFGIAKAASAELTSKTLFTEYGQMIGTPLYMSPEQAEMSGLDIDTRSDIYSLGVLLYELLTGTTPFTLQELREAGFAEMQRLIREQEPLKPSTRISTLDALPAIAAHRRTEERKLGLLIRGDLDWIIMKALEKDRTRRYETASGFADDLRRHLNHEPVQASPPGVAYRVRKFMRRNRGLVTSTLVVALVLVSGIIATTWQAVDATRERNRAVAAEHEESQARAEAERERNTAEQARISESAQRKEAVAARIVADERAELLRRTVYFNHIDRAEDSYDRGMTQLMREQLAQCDADLRGWEWQRLNYLSDSSLLTIEARDQEITCVAFSPDGLRIASGESSGTLRFWDAISGKEVLAFRGHSGAPIRSLIFSPDSKWVISGGGYDHGATIPDNITEDDDVKVWDAETGELLLLLVGHDGSIRSLAVGREGKRIVSSSSDGSIRIWDTRSAEEVLLIQEKLGRDILTLALSPDGSLIASGGYETLKIWNADTGQELRQFPLEIHHFTHTVCFSPDGLRIASGHDDGTARIWDVHTGERLLTLSGHEHAVHSVAFNSEGAQIASGSDDGTLRFWDAGTGKNTRTLLGHESLVRSVSYRSDGMRIVSGSLKGIIKVWDASKEGLDSTINAHRYGVTSVAWSPDGTQIVSAGNDASRTCAIFDVASGAQVRHYKEHLRAMGPFPAVFSPDGSLIASGGEEGSLRLWNAETGKERLILKHSRGQAVMSVVFSPDGMRVVASFGWDGTGNSESYRALGNDKTLLKVWETSTGRELLRIPAFEQGKNLDADSFTWLGAWSERKENLFRLQVSATPVAFSPDGKRLVTGGDYQTIRVWDASSGDELLSLKGHDSFALSLAFSPDGQRIVSGGNDKTIKIWSSLTGDLLMTLVGHEGGIHSVGFSPDGRRILSGSYDQTVRLWDADSGQEVLILGKHEDWVLSTVFSPDGRQIASGSKDGSIRIWGTSAPP